MSKFFLLPVSTVEGTVGDPEKVGGPLHVYLLVLDGLHHVLDEVFLPVLLAGAGDEVLVHLDHSPGAHLVQGQGVDELPHTGRGAGHTFSVLLQ